MDLGDGSMNNIKNIHLEPDSKIILSKPELYELVKDISIRIEELKEHYPHFRDYNHDDVLFRSNLIWYKYNIQYESNPNYSSELEARKKIPPIKKPLPPQEIAIYPEKDGIEIYIEFTEYEIYKTSQRIWVPDHWIGNYAVEFKVKGADTKEIKEIREKINEHIFSVKHDFEK